MGDVRARTPSMLFEVRDSQGVRVLGVPSGSYMVVADGWRGRVLRVVASVLWVGT